MFSFKFVYGAEIRRISVQNALSVEELRALAISLFESGTLKDFVFQYRDDEGDNVTISSDRELSEAFRLFHSGAIIRFTIVERKSQLKEESKEEKKRNSCREEGRRRMPTTKMGRNESSSCHLRSLLLQNPWNSLEVQWVHRLWPVRLLPL